MKAVRYHWKAIIRNKVAFILLIIATLFVLIPVYYSLVISGMTPGVDVFRKSIMSVFYLFVLFLFIGFYDSRLLAESDLKGTMRPSEIRSYVGSGVISSAILLAALLVLILIPNLMAYAADGRSRSSFFLGMLSDILLYSFFSGMIASLLGILFGLVRNLYCALSGVLISAFLASPFFWSLALNVGGSTLWYPVLAFSFVPKGSQGNINYYGWHFGIYRTCIGLLWLCVLLSIVVLRLQCKRRVLVVFSSIAVLLFVSLFLMERTITGLECSSGSLTAYYYQLREDRRKGFYTTEVSNHICNDFQVDSYEIEFVCYDKLRADVTMTLGNRVSEKCDFTLYHGYEVSSVVDGEGQDVRFEQVGDCLRLWMTLDVNVVRVRYSGGNGPCYANGDGIYLRPGFPYYPIAGKQCPVSGLSTMTPCQHVPARFSLKVHTFGTVYSNLEKDSEGFFSGVSDSLAIVCGNLSERTIGQTRIIYADSDCMKLSYEEEEEWWHEVGNALDACKVKPSCVIFGNSASELYSKVVVEVYDNWCFWPVWRPISQMKKYNMNGERR